MSGSGAQEPRLGLEMRRLLLTHLEEGWLGGKKQRQKHRWVYDEGRGSGYWVDRTNGVTASSDELMF